MASRITDSGTPFSLATASTTSNNSLLIDSLRTGRLGRRLLGWVFLFTRSRIAAGLVDGWRQPECCPVRDQARLLDVVGGNDERRAIDIEGDVAVGDADDLALQAPAAILRKLQCDFGHVARESNEMSRREQRTLDPGRRHLEGVMRGNRIGDVELCRHFAADGFAVLDADKARLTFSARQRIGLGHIDVQAQKRAAWRCQVLDAKQLQPERMHGGREQRCDVFCLSSHVSRTVVLQIAMAVATPDPRNNKGPNGPLVRYRWMSAQLRQKPQLQSPARCVRPLGRSRRVLRLKRKRLRGAFLPA